MRQTTYTKVPIQELKDFIKSQPPDKQIEFKHSTYLANRDEGCGCLFVQYALSKHPDAQLIMCGVMDAEVFDEQGKQVVNYLFPVPFHFYGQAPIYKSLQEAVVNDTRGI